MGSAQSTCIRPREIDMSSFRLMKLCKKINGTAFLQTYIHMGVLFANVSLTAKKVFTLSLEAYFGNLYGVSQLGIILSAMLYFGNYYKLKLLCPTYRLLYVHT